MSQSVKEILERIEHLPAAERMELEEILAENAEAEWLREAERVRKLARLKGIDQTAIDRAVDQVRHGS
jgi:ABC-type taurine transport system substrate-binding protein